MVPLVALVLASAAAPPASALPREVTGGNRVATARASARILSGTRVRQGEPLPMDGPAMRLTRQPDGSVLIEFS